MNKVQPVCHEFESQKCTVCDGIVLVQEGTGVYKCMNIKYQNNMLIFEITNNPLFNIYQENLHMSFIFLVYLLPGLTRITQC